MSVLGLIARLIVRFASHPTTRAVAARAIEAATLELVNHVKKHLLKSRKVAPELKVKGTSRNLEGPKDRGTTRQLINYARHAGTTASGTPPF